jgi:hypothetical protein
VRRGNIFMFLAVVCVLSNKLEFCGKESIKVIEIGRKAEKGFVGLEIREGMMVG